MALRAGKTVEDILNHALYGYEDQIIERDDVLRRSTEGGADNTAMYSPIRLPFL